MSNQHDFIIYIRNTRVFSIIIDGISKLISWALTIRLGIIMTIGMIIEIALSLEVKLKKITITSLIALTIRLVQEIKLKTIAIVAIMSQILKMPIDFIIKAIVISPIMSLIWRFGEINIVIPKVAIINIAILIAKFFLLSDHDPSKLWEMDGQSLEDLDYVIV